MKRTRVFLFVLAGTFLVFLGAAGAAPGRRTQAPIAPDLLVAGGKTWRVSVASNGGQGNESAGLPSISGDGRYVAFDSSSDNLVAGDTNAASDVFVHDNQTGETIRVSVAADGMQGNGGSGESSLSADGRYVAFASGAGNLVGGDADLCRDMYDVPVNCWDVFVYDLHTGQIDLVSRSTDGAQGNGPSYTPSLSADGRYVAFSSSASNLVPGDTAMCRDYEDRVFNCPDAFVHDRQTGVTTRVSVTSNGQQGNAGSGGATISADGNTVAFTSDASNLVPNDTNNVGDVFVHDRQTGDTKRVSVASDGTQGGSGASAASISGDGRYVTFTAWDGGFVPDDSNHTWDVFVHDRQTGATSRVSATMDGTAANGSSFYSAISADGRFVTFASMATNLIPGDTEEAGVVLRNMETGEVSRVSVAIGGTAAGGGADGLAISDDGRFVAFGSWDDDLVSGDTNETGDVFVHDNRQLSVNYGTGAPGSHFAVRGAGYRVAIAAPITVNHQNLGSVPVDSAGHVAFLLDTTGADGGAYFVSVGDDPAIAVSFILESSLPIRPMEGEGPVLLVPSGLALAEAVFLPLAFNVAESGPKWGGPTTRVSVASDGTQSNDYSSLQAISADGRIVVFNTSADNLVDGDTNICPPFENTYTYNCGDIFVHDRQTGLTSRISVASDGSQANNNSGEASISGDGRIVAFTSEADNLVPGDGNDARDVFVHDRQTGQTTRVSVATDGSEANGTSESPSISADGRFIAFHSAASNLVSDDTNNQWDVFLHDRLRGVTSRVSVASDGTQSNRYSWHPAISADARFVTFESGANNLVPGDGDSCLEWDGSSITCVDIFVYDRLTRQTSRVSVSSDGMEANGDSDQATISADGRFVAFRSMADNLAANDMNMAPDVFVHDRQTGQTRQVSIASDGAGGDAGIGFGSSEPSIAADGQTVAFSSWAENLVPADTNETSDVFVHDLQTGQTIRVSVASDGSQGRDYSSETAISGDGRVVAFSSYAINLVPLDTNQQRDVFVYDRDAEEAPGP